MHDDFAALFDYNRWANRRVLDACRALTPEQYAAEPSPGWSSIRTTLTHIAIVTEAWLRGIAGESVDRVPTEAEMPAVEDSARLLEQADRILDGLLPTLTPERLNTPQTFHRRDQEATVVPWMVLRHLVNHATYHRGQIASKLGRLGIEPPATDLIFWAFEKQRQPG